MKSMIRFALVGLLGSASTALAAGGGEPGSLSWLTIMFLFFGALIIVFQTIPGILLFFSMIKGLFFTPKQVAPVTGSSERNH